MHTLKRKVKIMKHISLFATLLVIALFAFTSANINVSYDVPGKTFEEAETQAVQEAILDYVEALYDVEPERIEKSVHQELRKRGYWYNEKEGAYMDNLDMTFTQLRDLAATWNKKGDRITAASPKEIEIYDVNDRTASAKLTAEWGIDYFHLAKLDGQWYIMNVLWQSIKDEN